jgi:putative ABC transport system permease protein
MSWRALSAHKIRTRFTIAAVAIGVASVLLLTSLGHSATNYVLDQFSGIGSNLLIVLPGKVETRGAAPMATGTTRDLTLEDCEALHKQLPLVSDVAPISVGVTLAKAGGKSRNVTVIGSTPNFIRMRDLRVASGMNLPKQDPKRTAQVCLVGRTIQRELFPGQNPLGEMLRLGDNRFRIIGILAAEGESLGVDVDELILVPVANVMKMVNRKGLFRVILEIRNVDAMEAAKHDVRALLSERHDGEDFTMITQQAMIDSLKEILGMLTIAVSAIAAISLAVAGVGIMNVMLISVTERTSEVGLMKAIGASKRQVLMVFLSEATVLALLGGVVGVAVGIGGAQFVEVLLPEFPMSTPIWAIEAALIVAVGMGVVFGVLPALKASRMMPVDALRAKV